MTYAEIAKLTGADIAAKVRAGELSAALAWTAFRGASRYTAAMARGDVATDDEAAQRASKCLSCEYATRGQEHRIAAGPAQAVYCGDMLIERLDDPNPTCGCLVAIQINGEFLPAGKVLVGSCRCPQGRW